MSSHQHQIVNLRGEKITGTVRVKLRPGIGIQDANGNHIEGGPHDVPVAIAQQLFDTNRADPVFPEDEVEAPKNRDPAAENRDPAERRRR
jgi:hypothetical protein